LPLLKRTAALVFVIALAAYAAACAPKGEPAAHDDETPLVAPGASPTHAAAASDEERARADAELSARLNSLCGRAGGECGVALIHVESGRAVGVGEAKPLALYSVFKLPLAVAVLKGVEEGRLDLEQKEQDRRAQRARDA
jgi:beta-lactamase class A